MDSGSNTSIRLLRKLFPEKESLFLKSGDIEVSLFKYISGVCATRIKNSRGFIVVLPFKGQQIWDAVFDNRDLKMNTFFNYPRDVKDFSLTYGCFLMHCGALRMGCPGPEDTHPTHGELPCADYLESELEVGQDRDGKYVAITGVYEYQQAFDIHYIAKPRVVVYESDTVIRVYMEIINLSHYPMELMYMAHINFRPVDNGVILQTVSWDQKGMKLREYIPSGLTVNKHYFDLVEKLRENPRLTQIMSRESVYDPEIVFYFSDIKTDDLGYAYFLQRHPDGTSDYVCFNTKELAHGTRWIAKNEEVQALGLALPATCDADGYTREKEKGNVRVIQSGDKFTCGYKCGYLDADKTSEIESLIGAIMNKD